MGLQAPGLAHLGGSTQPQAALLTLPGPSALWGIPSSFRLLAEASCFGSFGEKFLLAVWLPQEPAWLHLPEVSQWPVAHTNEEL